MAAKERILSKYPLYLMHQINRGRIKTIRLVIDQGAVNLEQLGPTRYAQFRVLFADHLAAFSRAQRFHPCGEKIILHCELADPGVKLFGLAVLVTSLPDLVGETTLHAFNRLPFTSALLLWVKRMLGRNLLDRLACAQRLKRHSSLKLI